MTGTARSIQPKTGTRAVPTTYYLGHTITDNIHHSVCFAIGSRRYEYSLTPQQVESVEYLCRKISIMKALNFAKRKGKLTERAC